jgi:tripartite-type tricarboxylate transporter receptor subunit TctC
LPDVPTVAESGAAGTSGFEAVAWQSLVAPAGTPRELINRYSDALAKVMAQRDLREKLEADGFEPGTATADQLAVYIRSETERWGKVIKASGASAD